MNFDASIKEDNVAVAYIIRTSAEKLIKVGGKTLKVASIYFVELYAAYLGLPIAILHLNASEISLEGDAAMVISSIATSSPCNVARLPILQDIHRWKSNYTFCYPKPCFPIG